MRSDRGWIMCWVILLLSVLACLFILSPRLFGAVGVKTAAGQGSCALLVRTTPEALARIYNLSRNGLSAGGSSGALTQSGISSLDVLLKNTALGGGASIDELFYPDWFLNRLEPEVRQDVLRSMELSPSFVLNFASPSCDDNLVQTYKTLENTAEIRSIKRAPVSEVAGELPVPRPAPNDEHFLNQWGFNCSGQTFSVDSQTIACESGSDIGFLLGPERTGKYPVIAFNLDSGLFRGHPDFDPNRILNQYGINTVKEEFANDLRDDLGHGTHTAGNYLMIANNRIFGAGMGNPQIYHVTIRKYMGGGNAPYPVTVRAIWWVSNIITKLRKEGKNYMFLSTNSWTTYNPDLDPGTEMRDAILSQLRLGAPFIVAAGNTSRNLNDTLIILPATWAQDPEFQAAPAPLIAVGATDWKNQKANFSSFGWKTVRVSAPGVADYSTIGPTEGKDAASSGSNSLYRFWDGTSMATPKVAAAIALCLNIEGENCLPKLRNGNKVSASSDKIPELFGFWTGGRLNIYEFLMPDDKPPENVKDAAISNVTYNKALLSFTVPKDYSSNGQPRELGQYDLRFAYKPIETLDDFWKAKQLFTTWPQKAGEPEKLWLSGMRPASTIHTVLGFIDKGGNMVLHKLEPFITNEAHITWLEQSGGFIRNEWLSENAGDYNGPKLWHFDENGHLVYRVPGRGNYNTSSLGFPTNEGVIWSNWQKLPQNPMLWVISNRNTGEYAYEVDGRKRKFIGDLLYVLIQRENGKNPPVVEAAQLPGTLNFGEDDENEMDLGLFDGERVRIGFYFKGSQKYSFLSGVSIKLVEIYGTRLDKPRMPLVPNAGFENGQLFGQPDNWLTGFYYALCANPPRSRQQGCFNPYIRGHDYLALRNNEGDNSPSEMRLFNFTKDPETSVWALSDEIPIAPELARIPLELTQKLRTAGENNIYVQILGYEGAKETVLLTKTVDASSWSWREYAVPFLIPSGTQAIRIRYVLRGNRYVTGMTVDNISIRLREKKFE